MINVDLLKQEAAEERRIAQRDKYDQYLQRLHRELCKWVVLITEVGHDKKHYFYEQRFLTYDDLWWWASQRDVCGRSVVIGPDKNLYRLPPTGSVFTAPDPISA